jgi:integrase
MLILLPVTIFPAVILRPYTCALASSSGRSDVPSSDTPREQAARTRVADDLRAQRRIRRRFRVTSFGACRHRHIGPELHLAVEERIDARPTDQGSASSAFRTAWDTLRLLANGKKPQRLSAHGRVQREDLVAIDLRWHDLRHEAACRWLAKGLDIRAIQLLLARRSEDDAAIPQRH